MSCENVGQASPDIAGLGIIISFVILGGLSFILSIWSTGLEIAIGESRMAKASKLFTRSVRTASELLRLGRTKKAEQDTSSARVKDEAQRINLAKLKKALVDGVLVTIADTQILNGISLLIGALAQNKTLALYHYHIIYDAVNFTGISYAAAAVNAFEDKSNLSFDRVVVRFIFFGLYLGFTIVFGVRLRSWDNSKEGKCYATYAISNHTDSHPWADNVYIGITCFWLFMSLIFATVAQDELDPLSVTTGIYSLGLPGVAPGLYDLYYLNTVLESPDTTWLMIFYGIIMFGMKDDKGQIAIEMRKVQELARNEATRMEAVQIIESRLRDVHSNRQRYIIKVTQRLFDMLNVNSSEQDSKSFLQMVQEATNRLWDKKSRPQGNNDVLVKIFRQYFLVMGSISGMVQDQKVLVLLLALCQYPVHGYMLFALRSSNEHYLSGDSENSWGFGQVVALVLVGSAVLECVRAVVGYREQKNSIIRAVVEPDTNEETELTNYEDGSASKV